MPGSTRALPSKAEPLAPGAGAAITAAALFALIALACLAAPLVEKALGLDAAAVDLLARLAPPAWPHLLGTDELGRDLFLRLLYGGRISLAVGILGAGGATIIGIAVGLVAGFSGGRADAVLMRLTDAVIALPLLPLLIVLAAVDLSKVGLPEAFAGSAAASVWRIVALIALFGWTTVARLVRARVLSLKRREFVLAARALGAGPVRTALWHILPNAMGPVAVAGTLTVGHAILAESVLSFLALGVQPPLPSWGNMLSGAQELLFDAPRLALVPGLLIFTAVAAVNLAGDGLQAALDPRAREPMP
jgi:peptide/nickel transport system permease protein